MGRLIIVSNRLPVTVSRQRGELVFSRSVGGVATGLGSIYKGLRSVWVGWPGISLEDLSPKEVEYVKERLAEEGCYPVFLGRKDIGLYYYGFCNKTVWPLFHYFYLYMEYDQDSFEVYRRINERFCQEVLSLIDQEDVIWVHDYHLMLLPRMIREKVEDIPIGFFLHIPFPTYEVYRLLPVRDEILRGLLGSDLVGFHTYDYVLHFLDSVTRILGYDHTMGEVEAGDRIVKVDAFPMGIDYRRFSEACENPKVKRELAKLGRMLGERKLILSVDRLDYTKGIVQRLEAFELFLERYPEYREKVTLLMVAVPTRTGVEHYMDLKREVEELVGRINGKFSTVGWNPIWYLYRAVPFETLATMYNAADVALVTPLRDGMNLIAKEYIAAREKKRTGVLVLSEFAGAAKELGEAIVVNPNDVNMVAEAIKFALEMPEDEQIERNEIMRERLKRYNVRRWASDFMESLTIVSRRQRGLVLMKVNRFIAEDFAGRFAHSDFRLLFLDYDGTLVPFAERPERAVPDEQLLTLLTRLSRTSEVVIISGRDRRTLEGWFGGAGVSLVAEHGAWVKESDGDWVLLAPAMNHWKDQIRPVMEVFVDRTPGSFIEEKEFSLAWHYRKSDPHLGVVRARELKNTLVQLATRLNLEVVEGNRVVEVRNAEVNKGKAALYWLARGGWDFVMAAGDDWTDEDMFEVMPDYAITIKVGVKATRAKYIVESYRDVRNILVSFVGEV